MSENDGRNESQLVEWAGLEHYLKMFITANLPTPQTWYSDIIGHSLMMWLLWMTISRSKGGPLPSMSKSSIVIFFLQIKSKWKTQNSIKR